MEEDKILLIFEIIRLMGIICLILFCICNLIREVLVRDFFVWFLCYLVF